jgi:hypothetical protein
MTRKWRLRRVELPAICCSRIATVRLRIRHPAV